MAIVQRTSLAARALVLVSVGSLGGTGAYAQAPESTAEIIVTTRKKEENLQEVPVAITAFTAEAIEQAGIRDLYDIAELTPGLSFFNAQGEFLAVPVIRGIAPTDIFGENNAAIFVDGVYVSGREGINFSQLDLERIEVVKGPQSALYGRNAFSGAINYVTRLPADVLSTNGEVTVGNDGRLGVQGSVSGPLLGEVLRGRIAGLYDDFDGSYDNPLGGQDIGGYRKRSWQGSLLWEPSDTLQVVGAAYYSNDKIDDAATTGVLANCENRVDTNLDVTRLLNFCGELPDLGSDPNPRVGEGSIPKIAEALGEDRDLFRSHLTIDWDIGVGSMTFITGYSNTKQQAKVDGNRSYGVDMPFIYCQANTVDSDPVTGSYFCLPQPLGRLTTGLLQDQQQNETEEYSQEIRFTSPQDRRLRYSAGGYFYDVESEVADRGTVALSPRAPGDTWFGPFVLNNFIAIGEAAFGPWFNPGGDADPLERPQVEQSTRAWSLFASSEYDVTDRLTVDVQARYGEEDKEGTGYAWDEVNLDVTSPKIRRSADDTFDAFTGRLGAKFRMSDNWMVYGSVANGEKSGGFDIQPVNIGNDPDTPEIEPGRADITILPFDNEKILATEIGLKGTTLDGRATLDIAVFHNDWQDVVLPEVFERDPVTGEFLTQVESFNRNAGDATVMGWEVEFGYLFTDNLHARLTGAFTDATWDSGARQGTFETFPSFRPADCQVPTVTSTPEGRATEADCQARAGFIDGNTVLRQPEWQASASLAYTHELTGDWDLFASTDASYQGKVYAGNDNQSTLPAHSYVNLRLGVESARYTIEIWGRNVFDDDSPVAAYRDVFFNNSDDLEQSLPAASPADDFFPLRYTISHPRLRTFGITGRVRFGGAER